MLRATDRVVGWVNVGDLRVRMVPGERTGHLDWFGWGSCADDVVRLHGTPEAVILSAIREYEVWWFRESSVCVTMSSRIVHGYTNRGILKVTRGTTTEDDRAAGGGTVLVLLLAVVLPLFLGLCGQR